MIFNFLLLHVSFVAVVKAQIDTIYWKNVPTFEEEFLDDSEVGNSKSEIGCSLEATKKNVTLWCFHNQECRLSNLIKVQSWNDSLLWNQTSIVVCRTKATGCSYQNQILKLYEEGDSCNICGPGNIMTNLLERYVPPGK